LLNLVVQQQTVNSPCSTLGAGLSARLERVTVGLAASTRIAEATDLYVRYDGEVGGGTNNNAFTAGLRMTW
jgi:hypothetical protein